MFLLFCCHIEFRTEFSPSDFSGKCCVEHSWASPLKSLFLLILKAALFNNLKFELHFAVILSKRIWLLMILYRKRKDSHNVTSFLDYKSLYKETIKIYFKVHYMVGNQRLKSSNAQTRNIQQMDFYWLFWINGLIKKKIILQTGAVP